MPQADAGRGSFSRLTAFSLQVSPFKHHSQEGRPLHKKGGDKMKLIISGASGLVATEVVRQSLRLHWTTTVVALARKPVVAPEGTSISDAAKLRSVVIDDYESYSDDIRRELAGAAACIWYVFSC